MPDWLSIHEPILINTIGHCAGALIFGMLLYYLLLNLRRAGDHRSILPVVAAALAMLWNAGSLVALATGPRSGVIADISLRFTEPFFAGSTSGLPTIHELACL